LATDAPIFVLGLNRSGTTLLSLLLDTHSRVAIPYESHFIVPYYRRIQNWGDLSLLENRLRLVTSILNERFVKEWDHRLQPEEIDVVGCDSLAGCIKEVFLAYARRCGKDIWGDKTPAYITDIEVLNRLFPNSRFVHLIRDGRDVSLSIIQQSWGPRDFITAMRDWTETVKWARKMLRMLPDDRFIELRFEDLVSDPDRELHRVTDFLGLSFEPAMLTQFVERAAAKVGSHISGLHAHLTHKPSSLQAYKWQRSLSEADQAIAHEIAGPLLEQLGYPAGVRTHPMRIPRKVFHRLRLEWQTRSKWQRRMFAADKTHST
jgi:hypothetical protein